MARAPGEHYVRSSAKDRTCCLSDPRLNPIEVLDPKTISNGTDGKLSSGSEPVSLLRQGVRVSGFSLSHPAQVFIDPVHEGNRQIKIGQVIQNYATVKIPLGNEVRPQD
jgi:hypothetical protein